MNDVADEQTSMLDAAHGHALEWSRAGKYHSVSHQGSYTVAAFKVGDGLVYRASKARAFIGHPVSTADEAKAVCQNNYIILGEEPGTETPQ